MVEQVSDFKMPEKIVTRLLKEALPDNVVISNDAKNAACRSASIFILQLSIAAAEKAQESRRRTLENQDIIKAVTDLGLGEYAPQLVRFGAQRKRNARRKETSMTNKGRGGRKSHAELDVHGDNDSHIDANLDVDMDQDNQPESDTQNESGTHADSQTHDTPEPSDNEESEVDSREFTSQEDDDMAPVGDD